ncbi:MAG TPA: TGS domain-containing protein, partial [Thermodesulfovibrionales bacterium]|nr:TGS domain-containing protein [Thermodesulfovibrionales bacterium]
VDLPPVGNESTDGWVSAIVRNADLILLVIDLSEDPGIQGELLIELLAEWKIVLIRKNEKKRGGERLEQKQVILAANKCDLPDSGERLKLLKERYGAILPVIGISTMRKEGIEELRRAVFENSRIIRVYSKEPGKEPDRDRPFVLPLGSSVVDLAELIHRDFRENLNYSCVWGSTRFDGQRVQKDYILHDRDVVEYHLK